MNLVYDQSIVALRQLLNTASKSQASHNIVLDFDGEVIIDPELHFSGVNLNKFKHRMHIHHSQKNNARVLRDLYTELMNVWSHKVTMLSASRESKAA